MLFRKGNVSLLVWLGGACWMGGITCEKIGYPNIGQVHELPCSSRYTNQAHDLMLLKGLHILCHANFVVFVKDRRFHYQK